VAFFITDRSGATPAQKEVGDKSYLGVSVVFQVPDQARP